MKSGKLRTGKFSSISLPVTKIDKPIEVENNNSFVLEKPMFSKK